MTPKQKKARARARRKRQKRLERQAEAKRERRNVAFKRNNQKKFKMVSQSLADLLPEDADFQVNPDGSVKISMDAKRGTEDEVAADIARRLNIPEDAMELTSGPRQKHITKEKGPASEDHHH